MSEYYIHSSDPQRGRHFQIITRKKKIAEVKEKDLLKVCSENFFAKRNET